MCIYASIHYSQAKTVDVRKIMLLASFHISKVSFDIYSEPLATGSADVWRREVRGGW